MTLDWIVLTMGNRPDELRRLLDSLAPVTERVTIVVNSDADEQPDDLPTTPSVEWVRPGRNLGVPGGRGAAADRSAADVLVFLDDDATIESGDAAERIDAAFAADDRLGAMSFKLVDDDGESSRRHVPRLGAADPDRPGRVPYFLGGASAVRASAYRTAGGYWDRLHYGHEELDLSWRLAEAGYRIEYRPDIVVRHPKTPIGRHPDGWYLTGRNRVLIARRDLPLPLALAHVLLWAGIGGVRARRDGAVSAYLRGWLDGWRERVERRPIRWSTAWHVGRAGRFPII